MEWYAAPAPDCGLGPVVATGVFDVLHPAHVRFLAWAAAQGRPVFVGVEADDRVTAWKGPGRPVNPLADRAEVLAALRSVAAVFAIIGDPAARSAPDYVDLLASHSPAGFAFSAGDPHRDAKLAAASALGAAAFEFPYQPGYSTTNLIARLSTQRSP